MTPLELFQKKIGVEPDGDFGPTTLKAAKKFFNLTNERAAHFFGQTAHESGGFKTFSENLNYSAEQLRKVFPKYFPGNLAELYERQPIKIASRVYGNRMGNGNEASREGFLYKGRGALQTTGKNNYKLLSEHLKNPEIMTNPDLVATDYVFESAMFFFDSNKLWDIADEGVNDATILKMTKKINNGTKGLEERMALTKKYYNYLIS